MVKRQQTDLFGKPIRTRRNRNEMVLERHDRKTLARRADRLNLVRKIFPDGHFLMPVETSYIFNEAKMAFINGQFISTLLLASAFIEHWLGSYIESKGFRREAQRGLGAIIECARSNNLLDEYLLDKARHLQNIRNPFVHLRPYAHAHTLGQRSFGQRRDPADLMEKDARDALSIMYAIASRPFR